MKEDDTYLEYSPAHGPRVRVWAEEGGQPRRGCRRVAGVLGKSAGGLCSGGGPRGGRQRWPWRRWGGAGRGGGKEREEREAVQALCVCVVVRAGAEPRSPRRCPLALASSRARRGPTRSLLCCVGLSAPLSVRLLLGQLLHPTSGKFLFKKYIKEIVLYNSTVFEA